MPEPPDKHLPEKEWTAQNFFDYARTGDKPVNPAYTSYRRQVLEDAGLDVDDEEIAAPVSDATTADQHFKRIRQR